MGVFLSLFPKKKAKSTYLQFWVTRKVGLVLTDFLYTLVTKWKGGYLAS